MTPPLRILVIGLNYAPETTGIAPYATGLAEGLVARGHAVRVITAHPHYPQWRTWEGYGAWVSTERRGRVRVTRVRHHVPDGRSGVRRLLSELTFGLRAITQRWGRPDVVLAVSPPLFAAGLVTLRARLTGCPRVLWVQDLYGLGVQETGQASGLVARAIAAVEAATVASQTRVVAIHDRFAETLGAMPGSASAAIDVVRNWSHVAVPGGVDRALVRDRLGWSDEEVVVLHAGNQGAKQGLENVVAAARLASRLAAPVRFVLLGDGSQRARLEGLAGGLSTLQFIDPLPGTQFEEAMAAADALLVNELPGVGGMAVPSKLTSYFAAGRPVVAATDARSTTAAEVVASGGGLRVDADDPEALVEAALRLASQPELAQRLGTAGRRYRAQVLSVEAALDGFERTLSLAARSAGHPST